MKSDAFSSHDDHHVVLGSGAGEVISISRSDDKKIGLNVVIVGEDGRLIAKVHNNILETNNDNYLHIFNPSPSRKTIVGSDGKTYIDVEYINSQTIRLEGLVRFRNFILDVSSNELQLGDKKRPFVIFRNSCLFNNHVDIMVGQ